MKYFTPNESNYMATTQAKHAGGIYHHILCSVYITQKLCTYIHPHTPSGGRAHTHTYFICTLASIATATHMHIMTDENIDIQYKLDAIATVTIIVSI